MSSITCLGRPRLRLVGRDEPIKYAQIATTIVEGVDEDTSAPASVVVEGHVGEEDSPAPRLVLSIEADDGTRMAVAIGAAEAGVVAAALLVGVAWATDTPPTSYALAYNLGRESVSR